MLQYYGNAELGPKPKEFRPGNQGLKIMPRTSSLQVYWQPRGGKVRSLVERKGDGSSVERKRGGSNSCSGGEKTSKKFGSKVTKALCCHRIVNGSEGYRKGGYLEKMGGRLQEGRFSDGFGFSI